MIYRKLTSSGDYVFGKGAGNFLSNSPETVAQAIKTALLLMQGEYFPDVTAGVPYDAKILGARTKGTYDAALQSAILGVQGVTGIASWQSDVDPATRMATVTCTVDTAYGQAALAVSQKAYAYSAGRLDTTFVLNQSILM